MTSPRPQRRALRGPSLRGQCVPKPGLRRAGLCSACLCKACPPYKSAFLNGYQ